MNYIPHTREQTAEMLSRIGSVTLDDLISEFRPRATLKLDPPMTEIELHSYISGISRQNTHAACFAGGGSYNHYIPSAISHLTLRGEFLTSYTPYQPEASQGILQALYEFQTYICMLTGMDVSNASLYDGASALAEAALLAASHTRRKKIHIHGHLNPAYRRVLLTYCEGCDLSITDTITPDTACVISQNPDYHGTITDQTHLAEKAHRNGALFASCISDPTSLALLKPPGEYGADIAVGEGQSFGIPRSFGGPYLGFMAVKRHLTKKMPGRIIGRTTDHKGNDGFVLTLQAREQFIRREKATSNITTNQTLLALTATIYLSLMGRTGLQNVAKSSYRNAHTLHDRLRHAGFTMDDAGPFYNEFLTTPTRPARDTLDDLMEHGMLGGIECDDRLLICCTEANTAHDISRYVEAVS